MHTEEFKARTKAFALRIIKMVERLPTTRTADIIGKQLLRSGTSVGANYRAACRAKSQADFIAKMGIVLEEADECMYWIEILIEASVITENQAASLLDEANQIVAMTVSSINTAKKNKD
jgi:four helix bundle protein